MPRYARFAMLAIAFVSVVPTGSPAQAGPICLTVTLAGLVNHTVVDICQPYAGVVACDTTLAGSENVQRITIYRCVPIL